MPSNKTKRHLICGKCGREWEFSGSGKRASCPKCNHSVIVLSERKHYVQLDVARFGKSIIDCIDKKKPILIFDCVGEQVIDVSTIE